MSDREETYIYESPDGGQTVYRRLIGQSSSEKELYSISEERRSRDLRLKREQFWYDILSASDRDPILQSMLEQVEIYYHLKSRP